MSKYGQNFTIQVWYEYPPIPDRSHDWGAYVDGYEEDGPYGWGRTAVEAIKDLADMLEEE